MKATQVIFLENVFFESRFDERVEVGEKRHLNLEAKPMIRAFQMNWLK